MIPVRDATWLQEAVDSVAAQTIRRQGWDLVVNVIGDGVSVPPLNHRDRLAIAVSELPSHPDGRGVSLCRNLGARLCKTSYLAFLDADDVWEPTKLEASLAVMGGRSLCICTSGIFFDMKRPMLGERVTRAGLLERDHILTSSVMTTAAFDLVGGFDPRFEVAEDLDFAFRALAKGIPYVHVAEPLVRYRKHPGGLTTLKRTLLRKNAREIRQRERNKA